ncbi:MAG: hypothetical protein ACE5QF_08310 [Thermoplasmata archaeon]
MRLIYCPSCDEVFLRSRIERNLCPDCGGATRTVHVGLSWQYVTSALALLVGAVVIILLDTQDLILRLLIFALIAVIAFSLSSWGVEEQKKEALSFARQKGDEE